MKNIHGIWLPETDTHFDTMITVGPNEVHGKGTYQLKKYRAALGYCNARGLAVDIGAHVGLWSRVMSYDFARVVAFEPLPDHVACFERNLEGRDNVDLHRFAISSAPGQLRIHMPADNTGHAHVSSDNSGTICEAITLDSFKLLQKIDFLKIDVEGWETAVVQGATETILRDKPVIIIEQKPHGNAERYGWEQRKALGMLLRMGYKEVLSISGDHILTWGR